MSMSRISIILLFLAVTFGCEAQGKKEAYQKPVLDYSRLDTATFAGGCFWCVEAAFEQIEGVEEALSGYAGGKEINPSYDAVANGRTSHAETVEIYYDPEKIDYPTLLQIFFTAHDPTQLNRQGPDIGKQYRSVIFYHNDGQKKMAEEAIRVVDASGEFSKKVVTALVPYEKFWPAEDYHQDYEKHHPRDPYIQKVSRPKIDKVAEKFAHLLKD